MKVAVSILILAQLVGSTTAYLSASAPARAFHPSASRLFLSSQTSDAAFSAFADSLEEDEGDSFDSATGTGSGAATTTTWQAKLDELLNPETNQAERQILLSELLTANEEIRDSVMDALASRKVC